MIRLIDHGVALRGAPPRIIDTDDVEQLVEYLNQVVRPDVAQLNGEDETAPLDRVIEFLRAGDLVAADNEVAMYDVEIRPAGAPR